MSLPSTIAVDGPAASGKSTIGGLLAEKMGYLYFDTGALYRAITWLALERGLEIGDEEAIVALAQAAQITITRPTGQDGRQYTVCVDRRDITWEIRSPEVDAHVSPVSAYPGVREALKAAQRQIGEEGQVVMVGRDIGTVILPRADLKVYLDASLQVRAQRRYEEVLGRGEEASFEEIFADMRRRDEIDSHRLAAPLKPAEEAIVIDTDHLSIEEVLGQVMALVEKWQSLEEGANR